MLQVFIRSASHIFSLFLHKNICCGYPLEVPQTGTSNEYPQNITKTCCGYPLEVPKLVVGTEALLMSTHKICFRE